MKHHTLPEHIFNSIIFLLCSIPLTERNFTIIYISELIKGIESSFLVLTKSSQGSVDTVWPVCGSHDDHMCPLFETIHQSQELRNNSSLHLSVGLKHRVSINYHYTAHKSSLKPGCSSCNYTHKFK